MDNGNAGGSFSFTEHQKKVRRNRRYGKLQNFRWILHFKEKIIKKIFSDTKEYIFFRNCKNQFTCTIKCGTNMENIHSYWSSSHLRFEKIYLK